MKAVVSERNGMQDTNRAHLLIEAATLPGTISDSAGFWVRKYRVTNTLNHGQPQDDRWKLQHTVIPLISCVVVCRKRSGNLAIAVSPFVRSVRILQRRLTATYKVFCISQKLTVFLALKLWHEWRGLGQVLVGSGTGCCLLTARRGGSRVTNTDKYVSCLSSPLTPGTCRQIISIIRGDLQCTISGRYPSSTGGTCT